MSSSAIDIKIGAMRVDGYLDERYKPSAPFVRAALFSKGLGLKHVVNFHVDTGARAHR